MHSFLYAISKAFKSLKAMKQSRRKVFPEVLFNTVKISMPQEARSFCPQLREES